MKQLHRQRGFTIATFALFLTALVGMAALAVDVGVLYTARTSAQHAADAAALAGAFTFIEPDKPQPATATNAAIAMAATNKVLGQTVTITAANVVVDTANYKITVTVPRTGDNGITTYFAKVLGVNSADVQTKATAQAWQSGAAASCLKPIFLPNTILSAKDPDAACKSGEVMFSGSGSNYQVTSWGQNQIPTLSPLNIRPMNPADVKKNLAAGQYYSLDFSNRTDPGASTYRCTLGDCLNQCSGVPSPIVCGSSFPIKTGDMVGPTHQGVDDLIGNPPTDTWIAPGEYQTPLGVASTSRALVVAPVWDDCSQTIDSGYKGQAVQIIGFATVFVSGMKGNNVQAYIVGENGCSGAGGSGSGSSSTATGPYGVPVRLVQNP